MTYSWLLITSILVFVMQAGFLCLESGKIRSKNSINVAAKNIADFIVSANIFWIFGFALMFGYSNNGFIGTDGFFFGDNQSAFQVSFFIFQMMFCGTAATLVSGAVAERMSFNGYLYVTIILSAFIYPVCGHWAWASSFDSSNIGWLEQLGFVDFAGSTMVHSVGGYVALAAVLIIGPRFGRFDKNMKFPAGNNLTISVLGTLLIWVGWFGFNGGSTLLLTDQVPKILLNTSLSATWGGLASTAIYYYFNRYVNITCIMNGVISGLVAITACCHVVSSVEAMLIGIMAGILLYISTQLLEKLKIDDALGVVPAHLVAGIWGTIALALFADLSLLDNGLDRWQQLKVQLLGIIAIGFYSFSVSYLLLHIVNRFVPLRVSHEDEMVGMNISEHRASSELVVLLDSMHSQQVQGDFSQPVAEEPFTEVGQIANKYNHVIKQVNKEIDKFRTSEKRKVAILDASMDSILTIDLHGKIIEFNHTAERTFGYVKKQVQGHDFIDLFIVEEKQKTVRDSLGYKFSTSYGLLLNQRNHLDLVRNQGERFPAEIAITCVNFDRASSNEYTLHIRDRTRQLKLQNKLKSLAYSDPLTGLYNRTYLLEALTDRLEHSEQQKEGLVLFFLDLDHFKQINDTLGHKSGDELLCEVARRLTLVTRESDIISRWGGDEFVILMTGAHSKDYVCSKANDILTIMREVLVLERRSITIPVSIGISFAIGSHLPAEKIVQHADIAMYYAKRNGRNTFRLFEAEMAEEVQRNFNYEQLMKKSILIDEQFSFLYQPKVSAEGTLLGLEALIRWHHPEEGTISPAQFIPIAEKSDLIITIGEKAVISALSQLNKWRNNGLELVPVSVNISGKHLVSASLIPFISAQLAKYDIAGSLLELEITEGVLLTNIESCIEVMSKLKSLNIVISIDDFGTGYSSLNYLKRLPIDVIKIDRSFVDECASSKEDAQICSTIISLAKGLELKTVAEGVETQQQLNFLLENGCHIFQGYFFHKPLPVDKVTQLLSPAKQLPA